MRKTNCEVIRRELDELMLDETCSSAAVEHLKECAECQEFQQKQTKLRQIVGSLGTVSAPPDFDFRLRARLASESSQGTFHLRPAYWPFARRGFAVAMLVLFAFTLSVVIRNVMNDPTEVADSQPVVGQPAPLAPQTPPQTTTPQSEVKPQDVAAVPTSSSERNKNDRPGQAQAGFKSRRTVVAEDFSSERAPVISGSQSTAVFPIDASLQSLKVSVDDGRGNARTISVPAISFGSQRMAPGVNQFAQKRDW